MTPTHPTALKVLATARSYVDAHYQEGPNNETVFGKWYGLDHQPWCAMFVSYCFYIAKASKLIAASGPKGFASCSAGLAWFKKNNQLVDPKTAQAGDIVFFQFDKTPEPEHVGLVVKAADAQGLTTYEGNTGGTDHGSQSNGDGVYLKRRPYSLVMAVARPKWPD